MDTTVVRYQPKGLTGLVPGMKKMPEPMRIGYENKGIGALLSESELQKAAAIRSSLAAQMPTGPVIAPQPEKKRILGMPPVVVFVAGAAIVAYAIYRIAKA